MIPEVDRMLNGFFGTILTDLFPHLPEGYPQGSAGIIGAALMMCAEEYDRAAEVRVAENADMRKVFGEAAAHVADADLADRLKAAAESQDDSLRISALNETNAALRKLLIELHGFVEAESADWAARIDRAIWQVLKDSAERRAISFTPM